MAEADLGALFGAPAETEQERMVEALLFAASAPLTLADLSRRLPEGADPATPAGASNCAAWATPGPSAPPPIWAS
jgi:hypothetical protein